MAKSQMPWNIILDIVCFILLGFADLLFHIIPIEPSHRGFFCDDQTLQKPFQEETISTWLTLLVGFLVSIPVVSLLTNLILKLVRVCVVFKWIYFNIDTFKKATKW